MSPSIRPRTLLAALWLPLWLAGCGGGSSSTGGAGPGGGGSTATIQVGLSVLSAQAKIIGLNPDGVFVPVTISASASNPYGVGGTYTTSGLGGVSWLPTDALSGQLRVDYKPPAMLRPGVYRDTIRVGFCNDSTCTSSNTAGQPVINVTYTVLDAGAGEKPSVTLAPGTVQVTGFVGDTLRPQAMVTATVTNPPAYAVAGSASATSNGLYSAAYSVPGGSAGQLDLLFKLPSELAAGTYDDTITVTACLDSGCANTVPVTPATIAAHYTITNTVGGALGYTIELAPPGAADVAWDATRNQLVLAVPPAGAGLPGSVTTYDPATSTQGPSLQANDAISVIALSDDGQYLYAGLKTTNVMQRFTLSPLAVDLAIPLGNDVLYPSNPQAPLCAWDIQVAPGQPHVAAIIQVDPQLSGPGGVRVFDDATGRPLVVGRDSHPSLVSIQWGADATQLFAGGETFTAMSVDSMGPVVTASGFQTGGARIHYANGLAYSEHGEVLDAPTGQLQYTFPLQGYWQSGAVDAAVGRIYFVTANNPQGYLQLEVFDLGSHAGIATVRLPGYAGFTSTTRTIRWGRDGLAIVSSLGQLVLLHGPLVAP